MNFPYRFKVVFLSFLAVSICYIDRVNISVAIIPMQEQFGWSEFQVGIILSSFYFGYMFTLIIGGYLADKYGGKKVLGYGLLIWSFFTIITPFFAYSGLCWLIFIRILMGLGEGITFPSWHAIYARWIPFKERTRAVAFTNSGIAAGTLFGYAVAALIIAKYSCEWVFYLFGILITHHIKEHGYKHLLNSFLFFSIALSIIYFFQIITNYDNIMNIPKEWDRNYEFDKISATMGHKNLLSSIQFLILPFL